MKVKRLRAFARAAVRSDRSDGGVRADVDGDRQFRRVGRNGMDGRFSVSALAADARGWWPRMSMFFAPRCASAQQ